MGTQSGTHWKLFTSQAHTRCTTAVTVTGSAHTAQSLTHRAHFAHGDIAHVHIGLSEIHRPTEGKGGTLVQILQCTTGQEGGQVRPTQGLSLADYPSIYPTIYISTVQYVSNWIILKIST